MCADWAGEVIHDTCEKAIEHLRSRHGAESALEERLRQVVLKGQFRKPAKGIPNALLNSFELIVTLVCAVPLLLEDIHCFYSYTVPKGKVNSLVLAKSIREKYQLLKDAGSATEALIKYAERSLVSALCSGRKEDMVKFFTSVGSHTLATQMVCVAWAGSELQALRGWMGE
ncbi:hypothetical protein QQZ08_001353 [Neonectria magnoliae]|uniref:Uncharacterized protein n=1 Tax=Neonectria magnoliae TaxID=2732573 RepID=A0ABR1IGT1_9HYPO